MQKNILIAVALLVLLAGFSAFFLGGGFTGKSVPESATATISTNDVNHQLGDAGMPDQTASVAASPQATITDIAPSTNSASEPQTETTTSVTPSNTSKADAPQSQKKLTVRFVNQFGEPMRGGFPPLVDLQLYDSVGEQVRGNFWGSGSNPKEGFREFDTDIVPGSYVIKWTTVWLNRPQLSGVSVERQLEGGEAKITVPNNGNWAVTIPVQQKQISYFNGGGSISLTIKNVAGTPLKMAFGDDGTVFNAQGKETRLTMFSRNGASAGSYVVATGGDEDYVPGVYTLKIEKTGYKTKTLTYTFPDVSSWSDAEIIAKKPGTIDLGTVILEKL